MEKSIWDIKMPSFSSLNEDRNCDVLIIGGGITGVSLCYYLKDEKKDIILLERETLGGITTKKSTAKLTYLQQDVALKIKQTMGFPWAKRYVEEQVNAMNEVVRVIKKEQIDCHLEKNVSYLYIKDKKNEKKLRELYQLYEKFNLNPTYEDAKGISSYLSFKVKNTYVFHPLLYVTGLLSKIEDKKNISIYDHTGMVRYKKENGGYQVFLENGHSVFCQHLVFANHYLPFVTPYFLPFKNYLETSSVIAFPAENLKFNAINLDNDVESIRFSEDYQLFLSQSRRLSNASILKSPKFSKPGKDNPTFSWHNYDLITVNSLPLIGRIQKSENLYIATGFNTWGMTNSNIAARLLSSLIMGKECPLSKTFLARYPFSFIQLFHSLIDNFSQTIHLIGSYFPRKSVAYQVWRNGKRYGVYLDKEGKKHTVSLTCPHMKCGLRFNSSTLRWECPCHGSEFDIDGNLLRGPSTKCVGKENK